MNWPPWSPPAPPAAEPRPQVAEPRTGVTACGGIVWHGVTGWWISDPCGPLRIPEQRDEETEGMTQ